VGFKLIYYLYRLAGFLVPLVPLRLGYSVAARLGGLFYRLSPGARANVRDNVTHILGEGANAAEVARVTRETFRYIALNYYDLFRVPTLSPAEIERVVKVNGWENVEKALAAGKGLIMVSAHFGNIEIVLHILLFRGVPVTIPVERVQPEILFQYICRVRTSKGLRLIPIDGPLLELFRALRRGEIAGLAADRDITQSGVMVDFFGTPARVPDGHVQLALRTRAPIVMGFSQRLPDNTFVARFEPPLELENTGDHERDVRAGLEKVIAIMERYIAQHPEQWAITAPIWRSGQG
jgi:KDO2-lipid IV(A) lauroyltransferase